MDRDVGGIGHQSAGAIKEGAGEIEPLADIQRAGALLQPHPHLLRNGGEAVVVELQQGGVWPYGRASGRTRDGQGGSQPLQQQGPVS